MDDPPAPELRIGDRERRATDSHLQQAHGDGVLTLSEYDERAALCWAARTQAELDELVRDLPPYRPGPDEQVTVAVPPPAAAVEEKKREGVAQRMTRGAIGIAVAGAALFIGSQVVTADDAVAVFGSRQIGIGAAQDRVEVGSMFGNIRVEVPPDVRVRTSGALVFGSTECASACSGPGREVVVDVTGAFSSVDIVRPGELTRDELEDAEERRQDAIEDARDDDDDD